MSLSPATKASALDRYGARCLAGGALCLHRPDRRGGPLSLRDQRPLCRLPPDGSLPRQSAHVAQPVADAVDLLPGDALRGRRGVPAGYTLSRARGRFATAVGTLLDLPILVPPAAVGFSSWACSACFPLPRSASAPSPGGSRRARRGGGAVHRDRRLLHPADEGRVRSGGPAL